MGVEVKEEDLQYIATIKSTKNPKNMEFQYVYLLNCNKEIKEYIFEDKEVSEVKYVFYKDLEKVVEEKAEGLLIHEEEYTKLFKNVLIPYEERQFIDFNNKEITGKIYGTNVRCLLKLVGTPYMPNLENAVLFLEGFHSDIIQWNAMLEQYNQMNAFNKALVFGYIYQLQHIEENKYSIVEELRKINSNVPIVKTNDFGHIHENSIIPIGADVTINANEKSIVVSDYLK